MVPDGRQSFSWTVSTCANELDYAKDYEKEANKEGEITKTT